jgi:hypothetical protein
MRGVSYVAFIFVAVGCERPVPPTLPKTDQHLPVSQLKTGSAKALPNASGNEGGMNWDDPRDPVAITVAEVVAGKNSVLLVSHDAGHGGWQFMDGQDVKGRKPVVIPKAELLRLDPSLAELKDLPVGWRARRTSSKEAWVREKNPAGE